MNELFFDATVPVRAGGGGGRQSTRLRVHVVTAGLLGLENYDQSRRYWPSAVIFKMFSVLESPS
jgi:hypothetical protein